MKITCTRERLLSAVSQIQGAVSPRTTLPILGNVLLEAEDGILSLTATDLDIGIHYKVPVNIQEPGCSTLPAIRLFSIIREMPEGDVAVDIDENHIAVITCAGTYFRIMGMGKEEFPRLPEFRNIKTIELPQALIKDMVSKTSYAVSHDESRHILNGILFSVKDGKARMTATDGRRLALIEKDLDMPEDAEMEAVIPSKSAQELSKITGTEGVLNAALAKNQIAFKMQNCTFISRLIEGTYPDYRQVIPVDLEEKISINRIEFLSALRRATLLTNERSYSVKLQFSSQKVRITANTPDVGESKEDINISYSGRDISVAFNPALIMDALKNLDTETISLEISDENNPGIIRSDNGFLYVIMPMQLN